MTDHGKGDALMMAQMLGLTVQELAQVTGQEVRTLCNDPVSDHVQPQLQSLAALAQQLHTTFGSLETAQLWLRTSNPVLDAQAPISYLLRGNTAAINRLLMMAETGMPT
jgi:hypothetical protein